MRKDLVIIGGPNGAGKTTAADRLLPDDLKIVEFVNADNIARGLSPFNPEGVSVAAARVMLGRMKQLALAGESFAFETTCSGRGHLRFLQSCREAGYNLILVFLWLSSPDRAIERVAKRVREKQGHSIPPDVILRRYHAGLWNMRHLYLPLVDVAYIYDNNNSVERGIAESHPGGQFIIHDPAAWEIIEKATQ